MTDEPDFAAIDRHLVQKFHNVLYEPIARNADHYSIPAPGARSDTVCELGMPAPPETIMRRYRASPEVYLANGKSHTQGMLEIMKRAGADIHKDHRILDFGCATGRMLRWIRLLGDGPEYWGADVLGPDVAWARDALHDWFHVVLTTRLPHLPFSDGYFDFVYACSVFTHIDDLADAWLLELRRITKPGGWLYITVKDETAIQLFQSERRAFLERDILMGNVDHIAAYDRYLKQNPEMFVIRRSPIQTLKAATPQAFYRSDYLKRHWGKFFDVRGYNPNSYGYQSAVVLQKRA